jgi:copper homeostasis protein
MRLEVIACSLDDALAAQEGGADRIELVRDLASGGLTPPLDLIDDVLARVRIPVRVMVRHTISHVVSDPRDREQLVRIAEGLADRPVDGLVIGAVTDGEPDVALVRDILGASGGKRATFHRAFESLADPIAALAQLGQVARYDDASFTSAERLDRILTNGGVGAWAARFSRLQEWHAACPPHLQIILGGGVTSELLSELPGVRGFDEIHLGRAVREPTTDDGRVVARKVEAMARIVHAIPR